MTALALLLAAGSAEPPGRFSADAVAAAVGPYLDENPAAAVVVGVTAPGGRAVHAFGTATFPDGESRAPDGRTVFQLGSISKALTGTVLAGMIEDGVVGEDDPAAKHLPADLHPPPAAGGEPVTLRRLATHTSGLPRLPQGAALHFLFGGDAMNPYAAFGRALLAKSLAGTAAGAAGRYGYSNLGVGLLGHALANAATGDPLDLPGLFAARLTEPLGLSDTAFALNDEQAARFPVQIDEAGEPTPAWGFATLGACGAVRGTADDVLTFADACLGRGPAGWRERFDAARRPRADTPRDERVGLCWLTRPDGFGDPDEADDDEAGGEPVVWHNGGTFGSASFLAILPESGIAVVVLTNCGATADGVAIELLK